jgi:hypothetical protein
MSTVVERFEDYCQTVMELKCPMSSENILHLPFEQSEANDSWN